MSVSRCPSTRHAAFSVALACSLTCTGIILSLRDARASNLGRFDFGLEGEGTFTSATTVSDVSPFGAGFKLRVGDQFQLKYGILLTPEVGYAFDLDHILQIQGDPPWNMNRIFGGARLAIGRYVVPTIYAHAGVGFRSLETSSNFVLAGTTAGFTFDTGLAVDFYLTRHLAIGPHLEFVGVETTPNAPMWFAFGAHADIVF